MESVKIGEPAYPAFIQSFQDLLHVNALLTDFELALRMQKMVKCKRVHNKRKTSSLPKTEPAP